MKKGGTPSGQWAGTQKRLRDKEEEKTPDDKTQREEDVKEANHMFFTRDTTRQSLPNIDIEMSGEPIAAPVFTTRTTPVNAPLLAFDPPPKKLDNRVDGQVYTPADGPSRKSPSTEVSQTVEEPPTRLAAGASSSKATIPYDRMPLDPGHLQSLTSIQHISACSETKSPAITILQKDTWGDKMLQMPSWSDSIFTRGEPLRSLLEWLNLH